MAFSEALFVVRLLLSTSSTDRVGRGGTVRRGLLPCLCERPELVRVELPDDPPRAVGVAGTEDRAEGPALMEVLDGRDRCMGEEWQIVGGVPVEGEFEAVLAQTLA